MNRNIVYLDDILKSIGRINKFINGIDYKGFIENEMLMNAVIRDLEIIGEASNRVKAIHKKYSKIPWRDMIDLRNVLIHEYSNVDTEIIWDVIQIHLPELKTLIIKAMEQEKGLN